MTVTDWSEAIAKYGGVRECIVGATRIHFPSEAQRKAFLDETGLKVRTFQRGDNDFVAVLQRAH